MRPALAWAAVIWEAKAKALTMPQIGSLPKKLLVHCTSPFSCFSIQCAPVPFRTVLLVPASKDCPSDTACSRAAKTAVSARFIAALGFERTADALASAPMSSAEDAALSAVSLPPRQACNSAAATNTAQVQETGEAGETWCACIFKAALLQR